MSSPALLDVSLIQQFDLPSRRDLPFPPLALFRTNIGEAHYRDQISQSNGDPIPRPLALDIRLPELTAERIGEGHRRQLPANDSEQRLSAYLSAMEREIAAKSLLFDGDRQVIQVHVDLSSPHFAAVQIARLGAILERQFVIAPGAVRAVKLPAQCLSAPMLMALAACRINRIRLDYTGGGFEPAKFQAMVEAVRERGFQCIEVEFPYGLTRSTEALQRKALASLIDMQVDGIVLVKSAPSSESTGEHQAMAARQLSQWTEHLLAAGYHNHHGKSFTRGPRAQYLDACGFCATDRVGLGLSAISSVDASYYRNTSEAASYCGNTSRTRLPIQSGVALNREFRLRREIVKLLLYSDSLNLAALERCYGVALQHMFTREMQQLRQMATAGLLALSDGELRLLPAGRTLVDSVVRVFDGHLRSNVHDMALYRNNPAAVTALQP